MQGQYFICAFCSPAGSGRALTERYDQIDLCRFCGGIGLIYSNSKNFSWKIFRIRELMQAFAPQHLEIFELPPIIRLNILKDLKSAVIELYLKFGQEQQDTYAYQIRKHHWKDNFDCINDQLVDMSKAIHGGQAMSYLGPKLGPIWGLLHRGDSKAPEDLLKMSDECDLETLWKVERQIGEYLFLFKSKPQAALDWFWKADYHAPKAEKVRKEEEQFRGTILKRLSQCFALIGQTQAARFYAEQFLPTIVEDEDMIQHNGYLSQVCDEYDRRLDKCQPALDKWKN